MCTTWNNHHRISVNAVTPENTREVGKRLGLTLSAGAVVGLSGPLGAGKTVFVQGLAEALEIEEPITSPSFILIAEYEGRMPLYHMDLYRLNSCEEFVHLGVEEMLHGRGVCVVEWFEKARDILPDDVIIVNMNIEEDGSRLITIKGKTL